VKPFAIVIILVVTFHLFSMDTATAQDANSTYGVDAQESRYESNARSLMKEGDLKKALTLLKEGIKRFPESKTLALLLAKAYLADKNDFWALRTLNELLERHPEDCEVNLWLSWLYLRQGSLDDARLALKEAACPEKGPLASRRDLLSSMIEFHANAPDLAKKTLDAAYNAPEAFPEDGEAVALLKTKLDPWHAQPLSWRLELWGGWTSNSYAGSPHDSALKTSSQSAFGNFSAWMRFSPNFNFCLHPSMEGDVRMLGYASEAGRDYSFALFSGRPGLLLGGSRWSALAAYRYESMLLSGGDRYKNGPLWFYQAHRAELEASPWPWLTLFFGAGKRHFREIGRTRIEIDGGVGGSYRVLKELNLMGAFSGRWQKAGKEAYDLYGGSLLLSLEYLLPYGMSLRGGFAANIEYYPRSAGYFDALKPDSKRRDILIKPTAGFWSQAWAGFRAGLVYEFADRFSTAAPYAYTDNRVIVKFVWSFSLDPWLPKAFAPNDHVSIDWELRAGDGGDDRIQDLLRQDEALQRGSSCLE